MELEENVWVFGGGGNCPFVTLLPLTLWTLPVVGGVLSKLFLTVYQCWQHMKLFYDIDTDYIHEKLET